jgi:hypothetical protein
MPSNLEELVRTLLKLSVTALVGLLALGAFAGSALANDLSVDDRDFYAIWDNDAGAPSENLQFGAGEIIIDCPVTLLGAFFENTIPKVKGVIGEITHAEVDEEACNGGSASVREETLPWLVTYQSFRGTLPAISHVRLLLVRATFTITDAIFAETCRAETSDENPAAGEVLLDTASGVADSLDADEANLIPVEGGFICGVIGNGNFNGDASVEDGEAGNLVLRLI